MKVITAFLVFLVGSVDLFSQTAENDEFRKNKFTYYSGIMHFFFDGQSPIKFQQTYPEDVNPKPINRVLQSSLGCQYERRFNLKSSVYFELNHFYYKHNNYVNNQLVDSEIPARGTMNNRQFIGVQLGYSHRKPLGNQMCFLWSAGFSYRHIDVNYAEPNFVGIINQMRVKISNQKGHSYGIHGRTGIDFTPYNWLTFNASLELNSFLIVPDNRNLINSRIDLSLRLGVGVNF